MRPLEPRECHAYVSALPNGLKYALLVRGLSKFGYDFLREEGLFARRGVAQWRQQNRAVGAFATGWVGARVEEGRRAVGCWYDLVPIHEERACPAGPRGGEWQRSSWCWCLLWCRGEGRGIVKWWVAVHNGEGAHYIVGLTDLLEPPFVLFCSASPE